MKFAGYAAPADQRSVDDRLWISEIERLSNGRIEVQYFPAQQLIKLVEAPQAVAGGTVDLFHLSINHFAGRYPISAPSVAPGGWYYDDVDDYIWAPGSFHDKLEEVYNPDGFTKLWYPCAGIQEWCFTFDLRTMDDFQGKITRAPGGTTAEVVTLLGGNVVHVPSPDVYVAAQTGIIDGCTHSLTSIMGYNEYEVLPFIVIAGLFGPGIDSIIMGLDKLNSLPPDLKDLLIKFSRDDFSRRANANMSAWVDRTLAELSDYTGVSIYYLPDDEKKRWRDAAMPTWDAFIAQNGPMAQDIVDNLRKYIWEK